jgi:hypothetical protein
MSVAPIRSRPRETPEEALRALQLAERHFRLTEALCDGLGDEIPAMLEDARADYADICQNGLRMHPELAVAFGRAMGVDHRSVDLRDADGFLTFRRWLRPVRLVGGAA